RTMIEKDEFREDLFFRINTFEVSLPPLRERRSDIPELARHLLARTAKRPVDQVGDLLSPEAIDVLLEHDWKGNVRELANAMEYAWIMSGGECIRPEHLPRNLREKPVGASPGKPRLSVVTPSAGSAQTLEQVEMEHLLRVLEKHGGSKTAA